MTPTGQGGGFTLIEVVLALGVLSFAMVSLLGMIPMGLSTFKDAMNTTVESHIVQAVANDLLLTDFSNLGNASSPSRYFDDQGLELPDAGSNPIYTATVTAQSLAAAPNSPIGLATAAAGSSVRIQITNRTAPGRVASYSIIVANNTPRQ